MISNNLNVVPEVAVVDLAGAQTVRTIAAAHERLRAELGRADAVQIRLDDVSEFDLSLVQLVLAARRSARAAGKSLHLAAPVGGALLRALDRAGFLAVDPADPCGGSAFWLQATDHP
ncbi:STAS domain-containing protein [Rhodoplanes azumiensis]|uniref:STAS domain-containing protein n=1 Tax=Rhodoplanes azumiensis TaxID=1897628 RepID=A0ABW5AR73_9BRAD